MELLLNKVYFDLKSPACYSSPAKVLKEARKTNKNITLKNVKDFLEKQATYTRFRHVNRKFKRLKTVPSGLNTDWQADVAVFSSIAKYNKNYNYLLVVVDVLSRKVYVEPVKKKTSEFMIPAFAKIFQKAKAIPWSLYTDAGLGEFCSKSMREFYKRYEIQKYEAKTHPVLHATVAERMIRTLKEKLYKYMNEKNTLKWIDVIEQIADSVNNSVNSGIDVRPNDVNYKNANALFEKKFKETFDSGTPKFQVGDTVRIDSEKKTFKKGLANFSAELFKIAQVYAHRNPMVYKIKDLNGEEIEGYFYEEELVKADIKSNWTVEKVIRKRKNGTEFLVKWKGFPSAYNRWITEDDLI